LALHASAVKRHRQSGKRREKNRAVKSAIRTLVKNVRQAVEAKQRERAATQLREVNRALDQAVGKGIVKRNTASRWLSRLTRSVSRLSTPTEEQSAKS